VLRAISYIPILTTIVAAFFAGAIFRRYAERGGRHLLWWGIGMVCYGVGTLTESVTTVFGWQEPIFRSWYITGALLGGAPLAQGTAYLLLRKELADRLAVVLVTVILVASACVAIAPIDYAQVEAHRLTGRIFEWQWVRAFSPFINLYAASFLIGGAIVSAVRYRRVPSGGRRAAGNALIALGALLPGIGGSFTRFGYTEVLYVTEFVGLLTIYSGYRLNTTARWPPAHRIAAAHSRLRA